MEDSVNHLHSGGVVILDFGSQYTQLIARRIREQHVFSEILPSNTNLEIIMERKPKALILSGGPSSVFEKTAPQYDINIFDIDIPILGICYGFHLLAHHYGGRVESGIQGEYGLANIHLDQSDSILYGISDGTQVWMSHMDKVQELPKGWSVLAKSSNGMVAAMASVETKRYATQFHPEVAHTVEGESIINNFLFKLACCEPNWTAGSFIHEQIERIQNHVGDGKVICGVSGGVDSSVVSALIHKAVESQCTSVLIDHGMLRKNEASHCISALKDGLGVNISSYDESDVFLSKLSGVIEPEKKRKIIGEQFIRSFEKVAAQIGDVAFLAQGTLYPDVIESGEGVGNSAHIIKSHHNVGGLPKDMNFKLVEPLRQLFKDEVRNVGRKLGLPDLLINRHPFPGPGLAVRVIGEVTKTRLDILREADDIFINILHEEGLYDEIWQAFAVLIPVKTVGVMGDQRTYEHLLGLRAVSSSDGMTADWFRMPDEALTKISNKIVNSVKGINRVVYDVTSKPPGTIEWE